MSDELPSDIFESLLLSYEEARTELIAETVETPSDQWEQEIALARELAAWRRRYEEADGYWD